MHMEMTFCIKIKMPWVLFILTILHTGITSETSSVQTVVGSNAAFSFLLSEQPDVTVVTIKDKTGSVVMNARGSMGISTNPTYNYRVNFTGNTYQKLISFIIINVTLADAGMYIAVLSTLGKTIGSQMLIVKASPYKPQIVELNGPAVTGSDYHLNCSAQSNSEPPNQNLSMLSEWRRNNILITPAGRYTFQGTQLTITGLSYGQDSGVQLTCVAFEDQLAKSVNSNEYILDVKYGPENIQLSPSGGVITERENSQIILNCKADCNPPCSFQWRKDLVSSPLANNQTLIINTVSKDDSGSYLCSVSNNITGRSQSAQITIMIIYGPASAHILLSPPELPMKIEENSMVNINCSADCYPDCNFTWSGPQGFVKTGTHLSRIMDRDKGGNYTCIATNQLNSGKTAAVSVMVMVLYGPGNSVSMGSIPPTLGVDLYQMAPDIICNATCNPPCDYRWYHDGTFYRNGATLSIGVVEKTTRGNYRCEAYTRVLGANRSSSASVNITVYYGAGIVNLSVHDDITVNESSSAIFQCHVDSNPSSTITWMRESNITVLKTESGVAQSLYRIESAECLDMDNYTCSAYNGIWTPTKETVPLFVRCHPRTDFRLTLETKVYRKHHDAAVLRYAVLSYPLPTFKWTFLGNGSESRDVPDSASQHNDGLQSELWFARLGISDFGNYSVIADNSLPPLAREVFEIIPADVPDVPSNVMIVEITQTSVKVQWVAGNSGGPDQTFHIVASVGTLTRTVTAVDPGYKQNGTAVLEGLLPKTKYNIYITAINSVGSSNMTEPIIVTTLEAPNADESVEIPVSAVAGGISAGFVVILIVSIGIFFLRRHQPPKKTEQVIELESDRNTDIRSKESDLYEKLHSKANSDIQIYSSLMMQQPYEDDQKCYENTSIKA